MLKVKVLAGSPQFIESDIQLVLNQIPSEDLVDFRIAQHGQYNVTVMIIYKTKI